MTAIARAFESSARERRAALIPYLMFGDPSPAAMPDLLRALADGGADAIEIGIPYSDPLADGPTIQAAAQRSIAAGTTFDRVLDVTAALDRGIIDVPLIAFTYYNPVFVRGVARTANDLARAGFAGAIIPDLPLEEAADAAQAFGRAGLSLTLLVAPTTPLDRAAEIGALSQGFVYVVSRMGVTGSRGTLATHVEELVARLRPAIDKPLAVGFGVSTPEHARMVARYADGVIVGSALIEAIAGKEPIAAAALLRERCAALRAAAQRCAETS